LHQTMLQTRQDGFVSINMNCPATLSDTFHPRGDAITNVYVLLIIHK